MPNKLKDLTGMRFGKLTVLRRADHNDNRGKPVWTCVCDCGAIKDVSGASLRNRARSCGRCKSNISPLFIREHKNRLYHTWSEMRRRCRGKATNRRYYSDKGISYCPEWDDFDVFARWAIDNGYKAGLEIDRINGDKDYSPENCRWVTHKQNARNRKAKVTNKTGVPGVQIRPLKDGTSSYRAYITVDAKTIHLGTYSSFDAAVDVRREAELKYWGFNIGE